jgi:glycosyltransferase involved in cell wall biosynthesis
MESHVLHLGNELARRGAKVTLVTSQSVRGTSGHEFVGDIEVYRIPLWFRNRLGWFLYVIFSIPRFLRLAPSHDIIHCHSFASAFAGMIARRRNRPLVVTIHTSHFNVLSRKKILRPLFKRILGRADFIITASKELSRLVGSIISRDDITPLTNAVDVEMFRRDVDNMDEKKNRGKKFTLFYSGHLLHKKGVDILIRSLPGLTFDWELQIVGEGPFKGELMELVEFLNVSDRVAFLGMKPHEEMPDLIKSPDVIVIPSRIEATSIAALEAMACGKVVVASNTGGLPEIVKEEWGYLFEAGDSNDLARILNKSYGERGEFEEMGKKAAAFVRENYSTVKQCDTHEKIYRSLLEAVSG